MFVPWSKNQLLLFHLNFGPLLHLQHIKTHIEAFPQSCRYGKYLRCSCLGGWAICTLLLWFFLDKLLLKKFFFQGYKPKLVFLGQNKTKKVFDEFQTFWIFRIFTENKNNPRLCGGHRYLGIEHEHENMLKIKNVWNLSDGKTYWNDFKSLNRLI